MPDRIKKKKIEKEKISQNTGKKIIQMLIINQEFNKSIRNLEKIINIRYNRSLKCVRNTVSV